MSEMRILTVRQPWAGAIIAQGKEVENRTRNVAGGYRGPVAIHAALRHDYDAVDALIERTGHISQHNVYGYGAIIGVVDLIDVHDSGDCYQESIMRAARLFKDDRVAFEALPVTNAAGGLIGRASFCSPWSEPDGYHMVLANPRPLPEPIPFKGALGLRRLPDDVADEVREGIAS